MTSFGRGGRGGGTSWAGFQVQHGIEKLIVEHFHLPDDKKSIYRMTEVI